MPAQVEFEDLYYPITMKRKGKLVPAVYVDATQLTSNQISVTTISGDGLVTSMGSSVFIPRDNNKKFFCKAMNPFPFMDKDVFSYALLCLEQGEWRMKYIKLEE